MTRFIALACVLSFGARAVADLALVRDGKANTVIIIPEDASRVTERAARELQRCLKKISGADLPIHVEHGFSFGPDYHWLDRGFPVIAVGNTALAARAGVTIDGLDPEGFRVETKGNVLFIVGREDRHDTTQLRSTKWLSLYWPLRRRGTLFGVYALLEEHLGVRWLWPGDLGEVVPQQRDIVVGPISMVGKPAFPIRKVRPSHMVGAYRTASLALGESSASQLQRAVDADAWAERQRMGESLIIDQTHAYGDAFYEAYHADHPEWFALQPDGRRMGKPQVPGRVRLCHANSQLHGEMAGVVGRKIALNPDAWSIGMGLDDVSPESFCQCDLCAAFGPTLSDRVARYQSAIAARVAMVHPDKRVSMFAYARWKEPPARVALHPGVVVVYVGEYTHGYLYAPDRAANHALWSRWADRVEGRMVWRPNMPQTLGFPIAYVHQWAEDLRRFAPEVLGVDVDALRGSWAAAGLTQYVMARLLWDPTRDVDAIIDDYCARGFGAAATPMRRYFQTLERFTAEAAEQAPAHGYHKFLPWAPRFYTDERVGRLEALLDEAEGAAGNDATVRERVRFVRTAVDWMKLSLPAWAIKGADGDRESARPIVRRMYRFLREHRDSYALYCGYIRSKIHWQWKHFFGEEADEDWSRPF